MKYLIICIAFISLQSRAQDASYGANIDKEGALSIDEALPKENINEVKLKGEIITTCAKKGCWMTMKIDDDNEIRVTFKDYGFFVPTEGVSGKTAIIQGELKKDVTDVETLRHYAEDAGRSKEDTAAITEPQEEFSFIATGVIIED
ncbi:MAG: DUF4920 domain-containing protein [Bacteroidota bacterium]